MSAVFANWLPPMFKATTSYNLRSKRYPLPLVSKSCTLSCFLPRALMLWNDLPAQVQAAGSAALFKKALKKQFSLILSPSSPENIITFDFFLFLFHPLSFLQFISHPLRFPSSKSCYPFSPQPTSQERSLISSSYLYKTFLLSCINKYKYKYKYKFVELRRTVHQISFCPVQQRVAINRPTKRIPDFQSKTRQVAYEISKLESKFMSSVARGTAKPGISLTGKEEKAYIKENRKTRRTSRKIGRKGVNQGKLEEKT